MMPAAAALALGYGLAAVAVMGGSRSRRPWLLVALAAGGIAFPLTVFLAASIQALLASVFGWGPDAIAMTLGPGIAGAVVTAVSTKCSRCRPRCSCGGGRAAGRCSA